MARLARTTLGTGLWLVRVLTVLCGLAVAGLLVWTTSRQPPALMQPERTPPPTAATGPIRPHAKKPVEISPFETPTGPTRFVRRLAAGAGLKTLNEDVVKDIPFETLLDRFHELRPFLLGADGPYTSGPLERRHMLAASLRILTAPARDLESVFRVRGDGPVRFWSAKKMARRPEFDRAEATIAHIASVAGTPLPQGYDVLLGPMRGEAVFPYQWSPDYPVSGLYFRSDRYCAVKTGSRPAWLEKVIKHELVHAYCAQFAPSFTSSRFVSEGLAEYLRCCTPDGDGFTVPAHRYAHNLARLDGMLRWMDGQLKPSRLVTLDPEEFYALRGFGYLMAQAAMAYIGADVIEQAFRERTDHAIIAAIYAIDADGFLRFIRDRGRTGSAGRAAAVEDAQQKERATPRDTTKALKRLGLSARGLTPDKLSISVGLVTGAQQVARVVDELLLDADRRGKRTLVAETSSAMDRGIELGPLPESLVRHGFAATTPREFVRRLHEILYSSRPVDVISLSSDMETGGMDVLDSSSLYLMNDRTLARTGHRRLIVCIASRTEDERVWSRLYRTFQKQEVTAPETVLVIDLSDGDGDGRRLANFFATVPDSTSKVTYWSPLARKGGHR